MKKYFRKILKMSLFPIFIRIFAAKSIETKNYDSMKKLFLLALFGLMTVGTNAQRVTDNLDRGLVAVKATGGIFCSWRILAEEYYDVTYNLYRDGTIVATNLTTSNYTDAAGSSNSEYTVSAVVRGVEQPRCAAVKAWASNANYKEIVMDHGSLTSTFIPNDACCADVDGDGELEILLKFDNASDANNSYMPGGWNGEYTIVEVYKMDGKKLWWLDFGPNMGDFQNNENNIVAFDWDQDGKAEAIMRAADGTTIHAADGQTYVIGDASKNYRSPAGGGDAHWFMHDGDEFLVYMNGETGVPYVIQEYPLKRLEAGETDLNKAWGDGYGHRSTKHFFGAPFLDGRKPSIFLARGIYTRHKMVALDVDPATHQLTERWRWTNNQGGSPWYGQGFHNFGIADVDMDGRDEICFGSMVIDDNGKGLSTTGIGHGDAQHQGDFDPYTPGLEIFTCQEDHPGNVLRDGTTGKIYYRLVAGNDDGRSIMGNFSNSYPGAIGTSARQAGVVSAVAHDAMPNVSTTGIAQNFRIYWDGDLLEETFNYVDGKNTAGGIYKHNRGLIATLAGSMTNNDTKGTACYQGDLFGDWREEVIMRTANNNIRIYTTDVETSWRNYSLWHDHQYRNAMVWQMCGYNQPPHASYFLGELENITIAPPPLTMSGRTEVTNGGTISNNDEMVITCETNDMTINVTDGATPYVYIDNAPSLVSGSAPSEATASSYSITYQYYTHTLTGGAFGGDTRVVKQGDGTLVLPNVVEKHKGNTDVWGGTLQFDGTFESSPLWLNRHTTLISNGGQFNGGIKADYNATIYPGGKDNVGSITTTALQLGFGSRIVFDIDGTANDQVTANSITIEKKVWPNGGGPAYDSPVFQIVGNVSDGTYTLATVGTLEGSVDDIVVEGIDDRKVTLAYADGKLTMTVKAYEAISLIWNGQDNGIWNTDEDANFMDANGNPQVFVPGSDVTFNDDAQQTTVNVQGAVAPSAIVFANEKKSFTLTGDSIKGEPTLTKTGGGQLTINSVNHMGATTISGGTLAVTSLANNQGIEYGALGDVKKAITIQNGATLSAADNITSAQTIRVQDGGAVLNVASGKTFTQSATITGSGQTVTKTGAGTLSTPTTFGVKRLVISGGTVQATENSSSVTSLPDTVEFNGGILRDPNSSYTYTTNKANFVVPFNRTGTFYGDTRCNYTGKLLGAGTLTIYGMGNRSYLQGDWSGFTGTLTFGANSEYYMFVNKYGLSDATLKLESGATVTNTHNNGGGSFNVAVGDVTGSGTLAGSGTWTIGEQGKNISVSFKSTSPIVKRGEGYLQLSGVGNLSSTLTVEGGELRFNDTGLSTAFVGGTVTIKGQGTFAGRGLLTGLVMESGTTGEVRSPLIASTAGIMKVNNTLNVKQGATLGLLLKNTTLGGATNPGYSQLQAKSLIFNGTLKITLASTYTPTVGDSFTLWTATSFDGAPQYDLPALPEGLYWDISELANATGVLRITDDAAAGIGRIATSEQVTCEVYTTGGMLVGTFESLRSDIHTETSKLGVKRGLYVVRMTAGRNVESQTVVVK